MAYWDAHLAAAQAAHTDDEDREEAVRELADDKLDELMATPGEVMEWVSVASGDHSFGQPVKVAAAGFFPLDGDHVALLEKQPTHVLDAMLWAGNDAQAEAALHWLRCRFREAKRAKAEAEVRKEIERLERQVADEHADAMAEA